MTTWDMDTVHIVVRLGMAVLVDRAQLARATVDVREHTRQKAARQIVDAAHTFGVEVHPDDVSAVEVPGRRDAAAVMLNIQWHPGWRDAGVEVELRGGLRDGQTMEVRHDQLQHGIIVALPMPSLSLADVDAIGPIESTLVGSEQYHLAGWRETERRWVMACS